MNKYFKCIILVKLLKFFSKDLLEVGIRGVGMNLRFLERSLILLFERVLFEKFLMYFLFCVLVFWVKVFLRLFCL